MAGFDIAISAGDELREPLKSRGRPLSCNDCARRLRDFSARCTDVFAELGSDSMEAIMTVSKVCVDPGHGMSNRSPNVFDPGAGHVEGTHAFREADIVLKYGLELKDVFRSRGIAVFMTRDDNTDQAPVGQRAKNAENAGCDTFISLHMNDVDSDSANGVEVLYRDEGDKALAKQVGDALAAATGIKRRPDKKRTELAVLKFNKTAILIELGFIANDKDRNTLLNPQIRQAVCEKIADVVLA